MSLRTSRRCCKSPACDHACQFECLAAASCTWNLRMAACNKEKKPRRRCTVPWWDSAADIATLRLPSFYFQPTMRVTVRQKKSSAVDMENELPRVRSIGTSPARSGIGTASCTSNERSSFFLFLVLGRLYIERLCEV